ncbi:MucR family transcriptional regulator [Novosphingobium sp. Gsoil 351]|uniref:MucR family transcriptional regulator n=1 Tax=Novosphingobium sp. Gsoil 351 TaxID=2675225 RepID=UPI0012B4FED8|nr:MucR family transcriptional regulator [Novosphingobium sp. Gsoil 351]QGN55523.1 transcriptional regulator [Novosphingobium sp. Gsoil 351]
MDETSTATSSTELAAELTMAWLSNPNTKVDAGEVAGVLRQMHDAVKSLLEPLTDALPEAPEFTPAVSVRKSLASKDHIISLIDGKPYKTLRRHLSGQGLTPDEYRARYGLKPDYPMVSESYSQVRRDMAKKIGLGRKPPTKAGTKAKPAAPAPVEKPARRGRPKKST